MAGARFIREDFIFKHRGSVKPAEARSDDLSGKIQKGLCTLFQEV